MGITYGVQVQDTHDPYVEVAEEALDFLVQGGNPGAYFVDLLPICE